MNKIMNFMFEGNEGFTNKGAIIGAILLLAIFVVVGSIQGPPIQ